MPAIRLDHQSGSVEEIKNIGMPKKFLEERSPGWNWITLGLPYSDQPTRVIFLPKNFLGIPMFFISSTLPD